MEIQIKDSKIFAPLKDKWLVNKPEEQVRQKYICRWGDSYGYHLDYIAQDLAVQIPIIQNMSDKISIRFFEDREVRAIWDDEHAKVSRKGQHTEKPALLFGFPIAEPV